MYTDPIVGYTFNADNYCPAHIEDALPTGPGEVFDGWALAEGVNMPTEDFLDELAYAVGYFRDDEDTFDSSEFPKIIRESHVRADVDETTCSVCQVPLSR
jgi:hypothetical protein